VIANTTTELQCSHGRAPIIRTGTLVSLPVVRLRPRILVLTEIPTPYRLPIYRLLAESGKVELELVFLAENEPDRPWQLETDLAEIPHRVLPGYSPAIRTRRNTFVYEVNPGILRLLRSKPWDAIVIGGYAVFAEQAAIAYARLRTIPYVLHSESHLRKPRRGIVRSVKATVLPHVIGGAAAGFATGSAAARYLEHYGLEPSRIRIVPNTVDVQLYGARSIRARAEAPAIRKKMSLPEHYLLYVGRLVEAKGLLDLVDALDALGAGAPTVVAAGEGPLASTLERSGHFRLLGFQNRDRLIELFALADAFVLPSRDEPWGVVVNEALACGTPVVATDAVGAAEDLITNGVNGRIVPVGNIAALAAALAAPFPSGTDGRIERWTYDFAVEQFLEGIVLAVG
jgi:glycosyltransferase involved in cell wall biosynthesis